MVAPTPEGAAGRPSHATKDSSNNVAQRKKGRRRIRRPSLTQNARDYCSATTITAGPDVPLFSSIENSLLPLVMAIGFPPMVPLPSEPSEKLVLLDRPLCSAVVSL